MKRIILDTNALMAVGEFKIDVFSEIEKIYSFPYKFYVLQGTLNELEKIQKEQRGKFVRAAKLALALLKAKKVEIIAEEGYVDELLVKHSKEGNLILTQDVALKKKLQKPYFTIRQKRRVIMIY